jgi:hypothetical protein
MENPYYIEPANTNIGMQNLFSAVNSRSEFDRVKAKQQGNIKKREEAMNVYKTGTDEEITDYFSKDPQALEEIEGVIGSVNERTKQDKLDTSWAMVRGEKEPLQALTEHADVIHEEKGDATQTIQAAHVAAKDPETIKKIARKYIAMKDGKALIDYDKAMGIGGAEAKDTRTTDIKNYEFAKEQGFNGSLLDFQVAGKDKDDRTTAIKEFEYGVKNPEFALRQQKKNDSAKTKENKSKTFKDSMALRKEFLSQSTDFQKVRDAYTRVVGSAQKPSPAGDLSLIFNYMKMLDPGSVVRESEFATAASSGSYGQRIQANVQKVLSGKRLAPAMRADFVKKSGTLMEGMQKQHKKREKSYGDIADKNNFSRDEVVVDINVAGEEPEYTEGQTANGGKIIFTGGVWKDNV